MSFASFLNWFLVKGWINSKKKFYAIFLIENYTKLDVNNLNILDPKIKLVFVRFKTCFYWNNLPNKDICMYLTYYDILYIIIYYLNLKLVTDLLELKSIVALEKRI